VQEPVYILGVNMSDHDRSVCLLRDGEIAWAIANERLDRRKHSTGRLRRDPSNMVVLPWQAITFVLQREGISLDRLDLVVVGRSIHSPLNQARRQLPLLDPERIVEIPFPGHHLSHAMSAYYCSPFDEAAVLVVDQMGSHIQRSPKIYEKHSLYHCRGTSVETVGAYYGTDDDLSLGLFYDYFTVGFEFVSHLWGNAGKLMGLAPYGRHKPEWPPLIKVDGGNTVILKNQICRFFSDLGLPRSSTVDRLNGCVEATVFEMSSADRRCRDLAYKAQAELEEALLALVAHAYRETGCDSLCLAGGVALNSVANGRIIRESPFSRLFIQPGGMDDGTAIGLAFYGWHQVLQQQRRFVMEHPYLGGDYPSDQLASSLDGDLAALAPYLKRNEQIAETAAARLAEGKIVAWFQGRSELGPRALGNRSILADPRRHDLATIVNRKKGRERFRPLAASVKLERASDYFELDGASPFMLLVVPVREPARSQIPAVVHVDGSCRIQTVTVKENRRFHELLEAFDRLTGIPLLLNTSFNGRQEPLVETPGDALKAFLSMQLDVLVVGELILDRQEVPRDALQQAEAQLRGEQAAELRLQAIAAAEQISDRVQEQDLVTLRLMRAEVLAEQGEHARALEEYQTVLAQGPDLEAVRKGRIHLAMGRLHLAAGAPERALSLLQTAVERDQDSPTASYLLSTCLRRLGQHRQAEDEAARGDVKMRRAMKLPPG
jgi:carbamoyltransferase